MDITWNGKESFTIKGKDTTVVINPLPGQQKAKGEVVLVNTSQETAVLENAVKTFSWPGEYEVSGVPVNGIQAWTSNISKDEEAEVEEGIASTVIFYFNVDGIKFCHLGEIGHKLTSETINKIGDVDILFVPAGENSNIDIKHTMDIIEEIDPRAIIPMGEGSFLTLLKEIGAENLEAVDKFVIKTEADIPNDKRLNIVLNKV